MITGLNRIGLTIDHTGVRYVKAKKKKGWEIEKSGFLPFAAGLIVEDQFTAVEELRNQLKHWVKAEKLTGAFVTVSIPTSQVIIRKLFIESSNAKELKQLIELEIETALHLPFEKPVYDYVIISSANDRSEVLVYVSPLKWIQQCVALLEGAGLKVKYAELASTALARAIKEKNDTKLESTMLINLDDSNIEIYMFHNSQPVFMRVMNEYEQLAIKETGLAPELIASINAEISRLLNFYQYSIHEGQSKITHTLVTGNVIGKEQLISEFSLLQPDMLVESQSFASSSPQMKGNEADEYRMAFGLAIRENKDKAINLLPERSINKKQFSAQLVVAGVLWFACLIVIVSLYAGASSSLQKQTKAADALTQSNALLEQELANLNKQSQLDVDPESVIKSIREHRQDAVAVLDQLQDHLPALAAIQTMEYSKPGSIALIVKFVDMKDVADYLSVLRTLPFSGGALLQGFTGTETQQIARFEMKWKGQLESETQDTTGTTEEGGVAANG
ncbi:pilus assembly protein PilM [Paenibacillus sp. MCAF9]|uniref:pilus assembly protein PilM n=1 Tax=Paenibacillus sp. MCAF9 TaxID=3233046 RepID=UPI003F9B3858